MKKKKFRNVHMDRTIICVHRKYLDMWDALGDDTKEDIIKFIDKVAWGKAKSRKVKPYILWVKNKKASCYRLRMGKLRIIFCIDSREKNCLYN